MPPIPSRNWAALEGTPRPLGVTYIAEERAYNFALFSRYATSVTLLIYAEDDLVNPISRLPLDYLRHKSGRIWHCRVSEDQIGRGRLYAYSVGGPFDPSQGFLFDSAKVLFDPYARSLRFPPNFDRGAASRPGSTAGRVPLGELPQSRPAFDWKSDPRPRHTHDLVIYEMHVRGFTAHDSSGVSADKRGTFAGVIEKIPYLRALGVTAVELLPVYQFDAEAGGNFWGYMPLSFFSVHQRYAVDQGGAARADEFRAMVLALHEAGIEVILDVVYNHTTEQGFEGPNYSYRGIDNRTYYLLTPDLGGYLDATGTGNTLRTSNAAVRQLVVDSLRFWIDEMHVDGFRFDLASVFSRDDAGKLDLDAPPIIDQIAWDPRLGDVRLIAEPWDIGAYQVGRSFPGRSFLQWNGRYRDDVRSFVKSDRGQVAALMRALYGSDDLFPDRVGEAYHAYQSINFVTCHDGFCMYDLVSYNEKHNLANGNGNRDGSDDNRSWNCGVEGDVGVSDEVLALRRRQIKNFCTLLFVSNGTPMMLAGDEFMQTQGGNNNPYNQDNTTTWLDWRRAQDNADMVRFWTRMIDFRKSHPSIGRSRYWRESVRWYGVDGPPDLGADSHALAVFLDGSSEGDDDIYVLINAYWEQLVFRIQESNGRLWRRVVDTSQPSPDDFREEAALRPLETDSYPVGPRSVVVLLRSGAVQRSAVVPRGGIEPPDLAAQPNVTPQSSGVVRRRGSNRE